MMQKYYVDPFYGKGVQLYHWVFIVYIDYVYSQPGYWNCRVYKITMKQIYSFHITFIYMRICSIKLHIPWFIMFMCTGGKSIQLPPTCTFDLLRCD